MDNLLSCLFAALTVDGSLGQHIVANEIAHHVAVHSEELSECIGLRKLCVVVRILIVLDKPKSVIRKSFLSFSNDRH